MELDILEKMRKGQEEKEAQAAKDPSLTTSSAMDKGKGPMENVPQEYVAQHVKTLIHTSQQYKQQLTKMASVLHTQEVKTTQLADNAQVTDTALQAHSDHTMVEEKPFKILNIQVSSIQIPPQT